MPSLQGRQSVGRCNKDQTLNMKLRLLWLLLLRSSERLAAAQRGG